MSCQILTSCSFSAVSGFSNVRAKDDFYKYVVFQTFQYVSENMKKNSNGDDTIEPTTHNFNCDCQECQKKFGSLPLLIQVIERRENLDNNPGPSTSSNAKTITCPHCNKEFTHRGDFNKHVRKHTGEQPYVCQICERKFAHTSNLNRHLKVHTGDRPYACDVCNKTFNRKDKLELHKKTKLCKKNAEKYSAN